MHTYVMYTKGRSSIYMEKGVFFFLNATKMFRFGIEIYSEMRSQQESSELLTFNSFNFDHTFFIHSSEKRFFSFFFFPLRLRSQLELLGMDNMNITRFSLENFVKNS